MPNNIDAERSVLGSMLLSEGDNKIVPIVIKVLGDDSDGEAFYKVAHREIYKAILNLFERSEPADIITVTKELETTDSLEKVGGVPYLDEMIDSVPSVANVEYYAHIVKELSTRRRMITLGSQIFHSGFNEGEELSNLMDNCEKSIIGLRFGQSNNLGRLKDSLKATFEQVQSAYDSGERTIGLPTGFIDLDERTSGYSEGEFIIIAGRPSIGKSTFVQTTIQHLAVKLKMPVVLFSAEMTKTAVTMRMLASESNVDLHNLRTGRLKASDWPNIVRGASALSEAPIILDDTAGIKIGELRAKAHQAVSEYGVRLIVVDYLQLVRGTSKFGKREETGEVSAALKAIGRDLNVPLIALSQLNRRAEDRPDNRPKLSDLRESGDIEQDADVVILLYRESYYNKESRDNTTEIIIAKQRNGPTGTIKVLFDPSRMRFLDLDYKEGFFDEL